MILYENTVLYMSILFLAVKLYFVKGFRKSPRSSGKSSLTN